MAINLYHATVPQYQQILAATLANLDKAEAWAREQGLSEADILGKAIAPDMWPLGKQFQVIAAHSAGAVEAVISGVFTPDLSDPLKDFASIRTLLTKAAATLNAISPEKVDAAEDNAVNVEVRGNVIMRFKGADFLLSFAQPNFYFHVTAAYAILRHLGVDVGKRDYLGRPRIQMPA